MLARAKWNALVVQRVSQLDGIIPLRKDEMVKKVS